MNKTVVLIWTGCSVLNVFSIFYNAARSKDYEMIVPSVILNVALAPIMTIIGFMSLFENKDINL